MVLWEGGRGGVGFLSVEGSHHQITENTEDRHQERGQNDRSNRADSLEPGIAFQTTIAVCHLESPLPNTFGSGGHATHGRGSTDRTAPPDRPPRSRTAPRERAMISAPLTESSSSEGRKGRSKSKVWGRGRPTASFVEIEKTAPQAAHLAGRTGNTRNHRPSYWRRDGRTRSLRQSGQTEEVRLLPAQASSRDSRIAIRF